MYVEHFQPEKHLLYFDGIKRTNSCTSSISNQKNISFTKDQPHPHNSVDVMCRLFLSAYRCGRLREVTVESCNQTSSPIRDEKKGMENCLEEGNQALLKDLRCKTLGTIEEQRSRQLCEKCQKKKPGTSTGSHGSYPQQIAGTVS